MSASAEYEDIYLATLNSVNDDDAYHTLMNKEEIVLETVNRMMNKKEMEKNAKGVMYTPVNIVVYRVFTIIKNIFQELSEGQSINFVFRAERRLYIGLFLVFCSLCFIILYKFN